MRALTIALYLLATTALADVADAGSKASQQSRAKVASMAKGPDQGGAVSRSPAG